MKTATLISAIVLALGLACSAAQAEKRELTFVKTESRIVTKSSFTLPGTNHEIVQEVQQAKPRYSGSEFQVVDEIIYNHADSIDGNGTHRGYFTYFLVGGDQTYGSFEGTHKTVAKDDGSWVSTYEGKVRYLGGTGKYKNLKGTGTYKGKFGSSEPFHEEGRDQIEY